MTRRRSMRRRILDSLPAHGGWVDANAVAFQVGLRRPGLQPVRLVRFTVAGLWLIYREQLAVEQQDDRIWLRRPDPILTPEQVVR